ncbi:hypothetical protein EDC94DRAFT_529411, partial [Helicostylum pulchrum]
TRDNIYQISVENNHVRSCSCPDSIGICKHMFLVSRIMAIPFSVRKIVSIAQAPIVNNGIDDKSSYISAYAENVEEYCVLLKKVSRELPVEIPTRIKSLLRI